MDIWPARKALIAYLLHKVAIADWHAVSDAANDLRVLEAQGGTLTYRNSQNPYARIQIEE